MFSIEICAYAVMSNHYHLVIYVDVSRARNLTQQEVIERWTRLFARPPLIDRYAKGECADAELEAAERIIEQWRDRLADVSWYMRSLNEHLARRANAEDECAGRFWEGRFKSQALLDEAGLLTAMAYVDLNPMRAGIAASPEDSPFTSIYESILAQRRANDLYAALATPPLRTMRSMHRGRDTLPFQLQDYLELLEWTGRVRRRGRPTESRAPILMRRLRIDATAWRVAMRPRGNIFGRALGRLARLQLHARALGQSWVRGLKEAERLYGA